MDIMTLGFLPAFLFVLAFGQSAIRTLKKIGARQTISQDAPGSHLAKQGTPTMGGILMIGGIAISCGIGYYQLPDHHGMIPALIITILFGLIGFLDDILIARRGKNLGLKARQKMALQILFAGLFVLWIWKNAVPGMTTCLHLGSSPIMDVGVWYYPLAILYIVGFSNAINFTDGLDGLASGISAIIAGALAIMFLLMPGLGYQNLWLSLFAASICGVCSAFLWFNGHPAEVFMGDTGSLALGAALPALAIFGKAEIAFLIFSIVPLAEIISVMLQVSVFKYRTRTRGLEYARQHRLFRRTPLHHHYEEQGMPETRIVYRFMLVTLLATIAALFLTHGR
jgi:phospho-N-acetylmuramoyl-pentapeptide-transferase